ncbi:MAG: hypothetical protein II502_03440 [Paludibacteraceae bacterium]|nr:hypothetical protein [Paludibacteraceae bacterium]
MQKIRFLLLLFVALPLVAQNSSFDDFKKQQNDKFNQFKADQQAEFDAFRKKMNEEYAEFMRKSWESFPAHEAEKPKAEKTLPPVVYEAPKPQPAPASQPKPIDKPQSQPSAEKSQPSLTTKPQPTPQPTVAPQPIAVKPKVAVVPPPPPTPEPIAPVKPKEEPYKKVSFGYFGSTITIGFPQNDNLKLRALEENAIADAWKKLSDSRYDITVSTALNARKNQTLCDWAYMKMLQTATEKQYGKTNEAVLMQAFLMTQSGYRIRLGMSNTKLYMLVASLYDIFNMNYYLLDGTKFYNITGEKNVNMQICKAKYGKEKSLSLQITRLPNLTNTPTSKRTLTSKKGVAASASVNKNMIDFFNTYPQACFNGDQNTRWAAYANTPLEKSITDMLYPPLKRTINGMSEREAVGILLNWVQTAFEYGYDDQIWGGDRAFFAQETLYYPYCDCEDRAILFSRIVRDLVGLDVVLLYYPGHLAAAVAFNENVNGDYLTYKNRKYIVCDPTYINAGVGCTMPNMNNKEAQVIALK